MMDLVTPCLMMAVSTGRQSELVMKSHRPCSPSGVRQDWRLRDPRDPKLKRVWREGAGSFFFRMSATDIRPFFPPPPPPPPPSEAGLEKETELEDGG